MISKTRVAMAVAAACLASSPALADRDDDKREGRSQEQRYEQRGGYDRHDRDDDRRGEHRQSRDDDDRYGRDRDDNRRGAGYGGGRADVNVPPGHLPPPGECRVWYPDRPPGHQPPPGDCRELSHRVPRGAFLIEG